MPPSRRPRDSTPPDSDARDSLPLVPVVDDPPRSSQPESQSRVKTKVPGQPEPRSEQRRGPRKSAETESFEHQPVFDEPEDADDDADDAQDATPVATVGALGLPTLSYDDDDDEDEEEEEEITVVGKMSDQVKALREGFRKKSPLAEERPDIEVHDEQEVDALLVEELLEDEPVDQAPKITVVAHGASDRGQVRPVNQDAVCVIPHRHTYVVADGMGGHLAGEVASALATEIIEEALSSGAVRGEPNLLWPELGDELARAVEMANEAVYHQATGDQAGMGTTVTAIRFSPNRKRVYIAHVGDSRCYRIRGDETTQLTEDHNMANLIGLPGAQGAQLSRAVGVEETVEVDLYVDVPEEGDRYLVCSDGLTKMLSDEKIGQIARSEKDLARCVEALVEAANARGGKDNIGVVLAHVHPPAS